MSFNEFLQGVLTDLRAHPAAWPFLEVPLPETDSEYYQIIGQVCWCTFDHVVEEIVLMRACSRWIFPR